MKGIINLYKPKGISSAAAVGKVKHIIGQRDVGHMGTLDPDAEGVLLIGIGKATRLFDFFLKKDKVYKTEFTFGYETDTLDNSGNIISRTDNIPGEHEIESAIIKQIGQIEQAPPKFSSKNINGRRAYELARAGEEFELKKSQIEIYSIELTDNFDTNRYGFRIHCSAGTYIRSICRDLAYSVGSLATMTALTRTRCGKFDMENSVTFDELSELKENAVISAEDVLSDCEKLTLGSDMYKSLANGIKIPCEKNGLFTVYCNNELFGLGQSVNGILKITAYLRG